jgi:hypothetical protein
VDPIAHSTGAAGWLNASLDKTSAPATLTLSAAPGTLAAGRYTATVQISASGASNSPKAIAVSFLVLADGSVTTLAALGQTQVFLDAPTFGTQLVLQPGSRYLIAVVNTNPSYTIREDFVLAGALMGTPASALVVSGAAMAGPAQQPTRDAPRARSQALHLARGLAAALQQRDLEGLCELRPDDCVRDQPRARRAV